MNNHKIEKKKDCMCIYHDLRTHFEIQCETTYQVI
jgi:hypothetical protein